ncbi:MAG: diaminopimelate decarboxylase [Syntrophobacterales bacterium]|nr:MAG: diaminopimelate decarboxylase [Syntrophobacterales bacterium]
MHHFQYKGNELYAEEVAVKDIVASVGSPVYIYSHATLERHYTAMDEAFAPVPHTICYSMKANSNLAVLKTFFNLGGGVDIVSGGELYRAITVGVDPKKVVYSGVGKKDDEIEYALNTGILLFNVESEEELDRIDRVAGRLGKKAGIAIRVNPDVDPETHPYITTGLKKAKFGINIERSLEQYKRAAKMANLDVIGVDCHIGSQLTKVAPFIDTIKKLKRLIEGVKEAGINLQYFDLGGGLGITYDDEAPPLPKEYGEAIVAETKDMGLHLLFEPGRNLVGNAGIMVTQCLYTKKGDEKNFVIVDAAMNDLARPSLYGSYHGVQAVRKDQQGTIIADIVGPICESGDFLAKDREMPSFKQGDLIALMSAGAYGFTMSSNYNSRPRAAEVMVKGDSFFVIREREKVEELIRGEKIPSFL